jgi:L-lactate dehydrogenase complex protein LldG
MSREAILSRVRASLAEKTKAKGRAETVAKRLKAHPGGVIPAPRDNGEGVLAEFVRKAGEAAASVAIVRRSRVAKTVSDFLRSHNLPQSLRLGSDPVLAAIDWPKRGAPQLLDGPSDGNDLAGLSHAFGAVSETGTLVLLSGPDNPTTVNFLPENHIVLVAESDIVANYEAIWPKLRRRLKGAMPRTVNMITGPSRSADIEQTLILGAHGPVRLHIIVVRD